MREQTLALLTYVTTLLNVTLVYKLGRINVGMMVRHITCMKMIIGP